MTLPAIFDGVYDPLPMYQLATLCRLNYSSSGTLWQFISSALRRHLVNNEISPTGNLGFPRTNILEMSDHRVLVIGGTADAAGFFRNFVNLAMVREYYPDGPSVGSQFWIQAQALKAQLDAQSLDQAKPMIIVGHSLGGAIGRCLAKLLQLASYSGPVVNVSFGCPRVGDAAFVRSINAPHGRCVLGTDLITQIPLNGFWFNAASVPPAMVFTNFFHDGVCLFCNPVDGSVSRIGDVPWSGRDLQEIADIIKDRDTDGSLTRRAFSSMLDDHKIWNYVKFWRRMCINIPRHVAEGFDGCNTAMGVSEDDARMFGHGVSFLRTPLPEDPIELLPYPSLVPAWDPTAPDPVPRGIPTPSQTRERALRGRRTF